MKKDHLANSLNSKIKMCSEFINDLNYEKYFFKPALEGTTDAGNKLQLGFSCYGLKFFYLSGQWETLSENEKINWTKTINSFQTQNSKFPQNSYVDENYIYNLNIFNFQIFMKELAKSLLNNSGIKSYDSKAVFERKSINAETKQAISTLFQVGSSNRLKVEPEFDDKNIIHYLNSLDWSQPWASGAQYSSLCVFSSTQNSYDKQLLKNFSDDLVDIDSGFYFINKPNDKRQLFNGAMKVISGLDWIDHEIHYPKKIIDFCLNNKPVFEGCDIVDYIYVLSMCSKVVNHKKSEVVKLLSELSKEMDVLFNEKVGGYSYFKNKSQTHYYGVKITEGLDTPDLHATLLCTWANIMILETIGQLDENFKTLKP